MYFFLATFSEGMSFIGVVEHFRKLIDLSFKFYLRFKVQKRVPSPPGDPKKYLKCYKSENQNDSFKFHWFGRE